MTLYNIISLFALLICFIILSFHFLKLIRLGLPKDYSNKRGNLKAAIGYSFTGAMNPLEKESAFLHFPTYTAGLLYHTGTFICFALYFFFLFNISFTNAIQWILISFLTASTLSGLGIFAKRIALTKLRNLSNPDDYISNLIVTGFQILTLILLLEESFSPYYFICISLLFLYLPLGKLKHSLYFFAARYHLGFFYGWRGVWPLKSRGHIE